jgi:hypothetical protein
MRNLNEELLHLLDKKFYRSVVDNVERNNCFYELSARIPKYICDILIFNVYNNRLYVKMWGLW